MKGKDPPKISLRILTILPLFCMKGKDPPRISLRMLTILPLFWGKCKGKRSVTDVRIYFLDGRREEVDRHVLIIISRNTVINKNTRQHWICMGGRTVGPRIETCFVSLTVYIITSLSTPQKQFGRQSRNQALFTSDSKTVGSSGQKSLFSELFAGGFQSFKESYLSGLRSRQADVSLG